MRLNFGALVAGLVVLSLPVAGYAIGPEKSPETMKQSADNLRKIAKALHDYMDAKRFRLPAQYTKTADWKPGLSWRVAILPMLGEGQLYARFNQNEAWDSPANVGLVAEMPDVYRSARVAPAEAGKTNYFAVTGDGATLKAGAASGIRNITDGTSYTICVVEALGMPAVEWTRPDDYDWKPERPAAGLGKSDDGEFLCILDDWSVQKLPVGMDIKTLANMFTCSGKEPHNLEDTLLPGERPNPDPRAWKMRKDSVP